MRTTAKLAITATAGNAATAIYINTTGRPLSILQGEIKLTTDATVANRYPKLEILDENDNVLLTIRSSVAIDASKANYLNSFMRGVTREAAFVNSNVQVPLPLNSIVMPNHKVKVSITNGVAGDSFTGNVFLSE